jgi:KipI family sensor histidine kinase inhibitor
MMATTADGPDSARNPGVDLGVHADGGGKDENSDGNSDGNSGEREDKDKGKGLENGKGLDTRIAEGIAEGSATRRASSLRFLTCGEHGILVECTDLDATLRLFSAVRAAVESGDMPAVSELVPAARTLLVSFDPLITARAELIASIRALRVEDGIAHRSRTVTIPVHYDGEDLSDVAELLSMAPENIIARHSGHAWRVAFVGFAPGFAYLTGGDPCFDVPRRSTPRLSVPSGAVGLAGTFSGVYPRPSSGGWQLIGHTDTPMWDDAAAVPALLQPGDIVRFTPQTESIRLVSSAKGAGAERPAASASVSRAITGSADSLGVSGSSGSSAIPDSHTIPDFHTAPGSPTSPDPPASPNSPTIPATPTTPATLTTPASATPHTALSVVRPGVLATIQDDGRRAANMGVTGSGAADPIAHHLANELVGNPPSAPVIELTNGSAAFTAEGDMVLAVTGAPVSVTLTSAAHPPFAVTRQEPLLLRDGETVEIGMPQAGLRDYLAVAGGFEMPRILGSAATDTMSGIGPNPLRAGQSLPIGPHAPGCVGMAEPWPGDLPQAGQPTILEVALGPRDDWFTDEGLNVFLEQEWTVTAQSNRVGLRLAGDAPLERSHTAELASEATVPGAVEVPTSGQPVIFLRDQPVTGGYPVIAVLTRASLALAGQLPPGATVLFRLSPPCGNTGQDGDGTDAANQRGAQHNDPGPAYSGPTQSGPAQSNPTDNSPTDNSPTQSSPFKTA